VTAEAVAAAAVVAAEASVVTAEAVAEAVEASEVAAVAVAPPADVEDRGEGAEASVAAAGVAPGPLWSNPIATTVCSSPVARRTPW